MRGAAHYDCRQYCRVELPANSGCVWRTALKCAEHDAHMAAALLNMAYRLDATPVPVKIRDLVLAEHGERPGKRLW